MSKPSPASAPSTPDCADTAVDRKLLDDALATLFAPWLAQLGLRVLSAEPGVVTLELPVAPQHVHGGGVLCGQTMMAACDTAMVLAIMSRLGAFRPMTTVQLQTSFLRPVAGDSGSARVVARVLRLGKNLVFGEVEVLNAQGDLAAHATTTYALL
jgi:uncharacterized protein (TIGR00369 family)